MKRILYKLFFDANDGLDLSYVFFLLLLVLFGYTVIQNIPLSTDGWLTFRYVFITLALMSSPVWLVKLVVEAYNKRSDKPQGGAEG